MSAAENTPVSAGLLQPGVLQGEAAQGGPNTGPRSCSSPGGCWADAAQASHARPGAVQGHMWARWFPWHLPRARETDVNVHQEGEVGQLGRPPSPGCRGPLLQPRWSQCWAQPPAPLRPCLPSPVSSCPVTAPSLPLGNEPFPTGFPLGGLPVEVSGPGPAKRCASRPGRCGPLGKRVSGSVPAGTVHCLLSSASRPPLPIPPTPSSLDPSGRSLFT